MAADYQIVMRGGIGVIPVTQTGTFNSVNPPPFPLGMSLHAVDKQSGSAQPLGAGVFACLQGSDVASKGQFVQIQSLSAVVLNANASASKYPIGVAAGVISASNVYGFVQVAGLCDYAKTMSGSASDGAAIGCPLYIGSNTDSGGYVLSDIVAGNQIHGVTPYASAGTDTTVALSVQLQYPTVVGLTASI